MLFRRTIILASILAATIAAAAAATNGEYVPPGESATMQRIVDIFERLVTREYQRGGVARRGAHAKAHGCVRAKVSVRGDLPASLRHGVFSSARDYSAWVRFSNGSGEVQADAPPDGRGMAIKLLGVNGPMLLDDERHTQDFLMIDFPVFFISDVAEYESLAQALAKNDFKAFLATHPRTATIVGQIAAAHTRDVLTDTYFSMSPYQLGSIYVKFAAFPVVCDSGAPLAPKGLPAGIDPNYLRERLSTDLAGAPACFDFRVQPRTDPARMPVEDPTVLWDPKAAPYVTVARISIPSQRFDTPQQQAFCENLSYTPWHGTRDFRPVGGINRLRLFVYRAISKLRHSLNNAQFVEPKGMR